MGRSMLEREGENVAERVTEDETERGTLERRCASTRDMALSRNRRCISTLQCTLSAKRRRRRLSECIVSSLDLSVGCTGIVLLSSRAMPTIARHSVASESY